MCGSSAGSWLTLLSVFGGFTAYNTSCARGGYTLYGSLLQALLQPPGMPKESSALRHSWADSREQTGTETERHH